MTPPFDVAVDVSDAQPLSEDLRKWGDCNAPISLQLEGC
jgi:hypothetical protein